MKNTFQVQRYKLMNSVTTIFQTTLKSKNISKTNTFQSKKNNKNYIYGL